MSDEYEPALETPAPKPGTVDVADQPIGVEPTIAAVAAEDAPDPIGGPRGQRFMSDSTRKLFQSIVDKHKGSPNDLEVDDLVPAINDSPEAAAGAATAAPTPDAAKPADPSSPAVAAPVVDVAAKAIEQQRQLALEMREKTIAERETKIAEREKTLPSRERFIEKPGATLRDLIKEWTGAESDGDLKDAITDAITELTNEALGMPLDPALKMAVDSRKALRAVNAWKGDQAKRDAKLAAERAQAEQTNREASAKATIANLLTQQKEKFPFLMEEENPHGIVWDVLKAKYEKEGGTPSWEEAAALTEKYLKEQATAFIAKRSRLLSPAAPAAPAKTGVTQGAGSQNRQPAQTQSKPPVAVASLAPEGDTIDETARRRRSLEKMISKQKEAAQ